MQTQIMCTTVSCVFLFHPPGCQTEVVQIQKVQIATSLVSTVTTRSDKELHTELNLDPMNQKHRTTVSTHCFEISLSPPFLFWAQSSIPPANLTYRQIPVL